MENIPPDKETISPLENVPSEKKRYTKPAIIHELELETRAGSPLAPDPFNDPAGIFSPEK